MKQFKEFAAAIAKGSVSPEDIVEYGSAHPGWLQWWEEKRIADIKNWQSNYVRARKHIR